MNPKTIRTGYRYRSNRLNPPYDAIVIGSGPGGLSAAVCLSKAGKKVLVLEQHYTAGGFSHSYSRHGYEWDVGVHYVGGVGSTKTLEGRLFKFLTDGKLQWAPMSDNYDRFYLGDEQYDLIKGKEAFRQQMVHYFPDEAVAIDRYLLKVYQTVRAVPLFTAGKNMPLWMVKVLKLGGFLKLPPFFNKTTLDVLNELTHNKKLIAVLTGQWGDYGLPPAQSSFMIHALVAHHYMYGSFYPVGGPSNIAKTMIPQIRKAGGEVFTYAAVRKIIIEQGRASGVEMADGSSIRAKLIISNAGAANTLTRLLPSQEVKNFNYGQALSQVKPALSHLCLYVGIKGNATDLGLPKTNFWFYSDENHDINYQTFMTDSRAPFPFIYISFPSAKDPDWNNCYPEKSTIEVVVPANYEWFEKWQDTTWGKRGADYDALKDLLSKRLLDTLLKKLPQLQGKIDYYELSTPLSTRHFCSYRRGEFYGLAHTPHRFNQEWLKPKTRIPGLYLTGQDTLTAGVVGSAMSGLLTACSILGPIASWKIMKALKRTR